MTICPNLSNKKVKAEFDALVYVFGEDQAYFLWNKTNGNGLMTGPDGAPSELFYKMKDASEEERRSMMVQAAREILDKENTIDYHLDVTDTVPIIRSELIQAGVVVIGPQGGLTVRASNPDAREIIKNVCARHGAQAWFYPGRRFYIHTNVHEADVRHFKDGIEEENDTSKEFIDGIIQHLQETFPGIRARFLEEDEVPSNIKKNARCFVKGNTVYLIRGRVTADATIEEFLHPLLLAVANKNAVLFEDLVAKSKEEFPKLWAQIQDTYNNNEGFDDFNRDCEIAAQALSRKARIGFKSGVHKKGLAELVYNVLRMIAKFIQDAFSGFMDFEGYINISKLPKMQLNEFADLVLARDSKFRVQTTGDIQYSIAATHKTDQEIAEGITKRFNVLYKAFEKIPNKSAKRQQTQNKLFELYNELQQHQDLEAVRIALDFGLQSIGTIDSATGTPTNTQSVLGYLDAQSKLTDPFSGITPQVLVDMYSNSIGFYENLLENYIPDQINPRLTQEDRVKIIQLRTSLASAKSLWTQAMVVVGDKIVDQQIDNEVEADTVDKENMKIVAKDWLHKNIMYGDINAFTSYVFNYGYSSNPIIRQAFHLIQGAETKTLAEIHPIAQRVAKAFRKADKGFKSLTYNWQTILQEHTVDGIPTGNFVRDINYGQYEIDLENFIKELNEKFINDYGHTYIDENGVVVNSLTGELADEEEWSTGEPTYIKYLKEIEHWKCEHAHRRYTEAYYMERLSQPYKGSLDPNDVDVNKFGHGLSPKALTRYNHIQSNINYYLDKCTDKDTGLTYPERLNDQDKASLDAWQDALDQLQNPFNEDMTPKIDDERQVAFEIRAWQKWLGEKMTTEINLDDYVAGLQKLQAEATATGNYKIVQDFVKYNSSYGIHPEFIEQTIGRFAKLHPTDQDVIHAMYYRSALQSAVKTKTGYTRDLEKMENRPEFWLDCKHMDQIIEDGKSKGDPDFAKEFEENFGFDEILYRDAYGRAIDSAGNPVKPEDEGMHNDLLTYQQYLVNKYTNLAYNSPTRTILGLNDQNGNPIIFNGTIDDVRQIIEKLFSYRKTKQSGSNLTVEYVPLTIFSMMKPKKDSFVNVKNGRTERTMLYVPRGRFAERFDKSGTYINRSYDKSNLNAEQPRKDYIQDGIARYDNSESFGKIKGDVKELYDKLIETMQLAQDAYSTQNRRFNYRLPQIEADGMQLMTRLLNNGFKNTAAALFDSITTVQENDESMRTTDDYMTNPDGSVATDVPLKFVRRLKDPSRLTTDVVGSVILFMNMALNYKNKTEIDAQLKTLRFNMDPNFRAGVELEKDEFAPSDNSNSVDMFDSMLNNHMYNNQWTKAPQTGADSRTMVAWKKTMRKVHRLETTQMLALNLFSMIVGFGDSMTRIFKESIMGKYMSLRDSLTSLADIIVRYTGPVIANIGNPVANNKLTRAMQVNGISKGVHQTYEHTNYGRIRKVFYNLLMGGFSMLDWMANALLLRSYYNNIRFYDGGIVPTGFYSAYELKQAFVNAGHTKKEAYFAHMWSTRTLWGAYDSNMQVKPEYEQYVTQKIKTRIRTKTLQRAALYNGMNPDNDLPTYKTKLIGAFVGAMRGWLTQAIEHLFAGGSDNIVRNVHKVYDLQIKRSKTFKYHHTKSDKLTDEQRSRRMSWNYETGTPNDQIYIGIARAFNTFSKKLWRYATLNFAKAKEAKFSYVEKYAWRDAIIYLGILALCMVAWPMLNEQAAQVPPPKDREEAGPMSVQDVPRWFNEQYIGDQYWKMQASDIAFRVIEAQITSIDPTSAMDVVNSITTLNSGVNEHIGLLKATGDVLGVSGHSTDEVVKQGGYKYYTRGERNLYKAIGPLDNLQTAFTYYGIKTNQQFYTNTYGGIYRFVGYDFKHEKDKKKKGPSFSGPQQKGPKFKGPTFK